MGTVELAMVGLAGSGVGTALAVPMVWPPRRAHRATEVRLMGWWLLAGSGLAALISARLLGLVPRTAAIEHAVNLIGLSAFPLLYLYVRELTGRPARIASAWWLWVPAGLYAAVLMARSALDTTTRVPFAWILPVALGCTALCAFAAFRGRAEERPGIVSARWIVGSMAALNVAQVVRMQFGEVAPIPALVPVVMAGIFLVMVGLVARSALESPPAGGPDSSRPRYERSGLDEQAAARLFAGIERALSADRLFADPDLTLGRLAAAAGATPHQVSEALSRHERTFHGLLSRRRVEDVKLQLFDPSADRFTIEGIGASAGFGSRSALYAAFRRLEGMTPAEFRARVRRRQDATGATPEGTRARR